MTIGPIEFLGESPAHEVPPSEYGGADGLIQPPPHDMTVSEVSAAIARAAQNPNGIDPITGLDSDVLTAR